MKKKKITFSEPNCRFGCPHFKSVGSVLNEAQDRSYFERQAQQVGRYKDLGMPHQA